MVHFFYLVHNARLRGWQRITTKLKHNNRNHRGSMGLETPRVGSPFEAFVIAVLLVARGHMMCCT
ncbi:hypothetical protein DJ324_17765 [Vibrio cholerae]|nr:hypothetical protein [Vibrio cholerae]EGR3853257.1 hypothetical protein [Vibrio cholerae]EGR4214500.1 hypothetical protein [Vibrio cholerae]EGR4481944.1 hypothetical protein [Vibrio cholerae]MBG8952320.1 hypothetical protein [Vibrio cholerae]